jgi:hypothetical protein
MLKRTVLPVCLCLLTVAVVVAIAIARDPNGFSLKDWQTITASFVALGAATLAYSAAMAKVAFDESTAKETERRKTLGIFLRFDFAVDVLKYEAEYRLEEVELPTSPSENNIVVVDDLALSEMPEIKEAISPLLCPRHLIVIKNDLYNFMHSRKTMRGKVTRSNMA